MVTSTNNNPAASLISSLNAANSSLATSGSSSSSSAGSATSLQNRFMTLLTTQLQNQDPLNPMDNSQLTSQLAQISSVQGISQMNTTLQNLTSSMVASSGTSMIGHTVLVPGSTVDLANGKGVAGVQLQNNADNLTVTIKDAAGNTVRTMDMGAQKSGIIPISWDGKDNAGNALASGAYSISAQATTAGNTSSPTTLSGGTVNAVLPSASGTTLDLAQLGSFDISKIMMVM